MFERFTEPARRAAESAERLGHRRVETEHLLIGILRVAESMAAQILIARGVKLGSIEEHVATAPPNYQREPSTSASLALNSFLAGLKWLNCEELIPFFAKNAIFIDASGKRWSREEMSKGFEMLSSTRVTDKPEV